MFDLSSLVWLLLPLGIVLGWVLSTRMRAPVGARPPPDEAEPAASGPVATLSDPGTDGVDAAVGPEPALAEMQLELGALFRHRGEIDRAIALHERLLAAAPAGAATRDAVQYELAQDYLKAGLMDRAEALLSGLLQQGSQVATALETLLSIHEQARDWRRAIDVTRRLQATRAKNLGSLLAHYHCELAEQAQAADDPDEAERLARRALDAHPDSVRASLLLGELAEKRGDAVAALRAYRRIPQQDARFLAEAIPRLSRCCEAIGEPTLFAEFIEEAEERFPEAVSVTLERARALAAQGGDAAAYLVRRLAHHPSWPGLLALLDIRAAGEAGSGELAALRDALRKRIAARPAWRCTSCGLTPSLLFWQCPSCRRWDSILPDEDRL